MPNWKQNVRRRAVRPFVRMRVAFALIVSAILVGGVMTGAGREALAATATVPVQAAPDQTAPGRGPAVQGDTAKPPKASKGRASAAAPPATTPLLGKWEVVDAAPAPWTPEKERPALADHARRMLKTQIVFQAREVVSANKSLACKRADYEQTEYSPDALFRGALPEPNQDSVARTLGLPRGDVPGVDVDCFGETVSYHFRDKSTAMFALDDVIYTLSRR